MKTITTYCKCFNNFSYHHQCIANWTGVIMLHCCKFLLVTQEKSALKKWKTRRAVSAVTLWREAYVRSHMSQLDTRRWWWRVTSWVRHWALVTSEKCIEASTGCLHSALVCVLESTKIRESAAAANCCCSFLIDRSTSRKQTATKFGNSIRRAHKLGQQTCQQKVISENYETQPYAVRKVCPVL